VNSADFSHQERFASHTQWAHCVFGVWLCAGFCIEGFTSKASEEFKITGTRCVGVGVGVGACGSFACALLLFKITDTQCVSFMYRVAKTHRIPYLHRSFSAKVTNI